MCARLRNQIKEHLSEKSEIAIAAFAVPIAGCLLYPVLHAFVYSNVHIFSLLLLLSTAFGYGLVRVFGNSRADSTFETAWFSRRRTRLLFIVAFVVFAFFVSTYPRVQSTEPIGGDTGMYVWKLRLIDVKGPLWSIQYSDNPLSLLFFYEIGHLLAVDSFVLFTFLPGILLVFFLLSLYVYSMEISRGLKEEERIIVPLFSLAVAATSTITLRVSIDLHAQMLALSLQNIVFALFLEGYRSMRWRPVAIGFVLFSLLTLVHTATFIISMVQILAFVGVSVLLSENKQKTVRLLVPVLFGFLVISLLALIHYRYSLFAVGNLLSVVFPQTQQPFYAYTSPHTIAFAPLFDSKSYLHKFVMGDIGLTFGNVIPSLFATMGCPLLLRNADVGKRFLLVQISLNSFLAIGALGILGQQSWRFAVFVPIAIMAGVFTAFLFRSVRQVCLSSSFLRKRKLTLNIRLPFKHIGIASLLTILLLGGMLCIQWENQLANYPYKVSADAMAEISSAKEIFGRANSSIIVLVRDADCWNVVGYMLSPACIYAGNLAYLLAEKSEPLMLVRGFLDKYIGGVQSLEQVGAFGHLDKYAIVLTEHTYHPDSLEKEMLQEISNGVYAARNLTLPARLAFFEEWRRSKGLNKAFGGDDSCFIFADTSSTRSWTAVNQGGGSSSLVPSSGIDGIFKNTLRGYNLVLEYHFESPANISQHDFIVLDIFFDFTPLDTRFEIVDISGNSRYWILNGVERPSFSPDSGLYIGSWNRVILPVHFYTSESPQRTNLSAISYIRLKATPETMETANMKLDNMRIGEGIDSAPVEVIDFITYNSPLPWECILGVSILDLFVVLVLIMRTRKYQPAAVRE